METSSKPVESQLGNRLLIWVSSIPRHARRPARLVDPRRHLGPSSPSGRTSAKEAGVAAIEFALLLPVLIAILLGIIDFGFMLYDKAMITNAAREAARAGIVLRSPRLTGAQIQAEATNYCSTFLIRMYGPATCIVTSSNLTAPGSLSNCLNFADRMSVKVTYAYNGPIIGFYNTLVGPIVMGSEAVMRCE